MGWAGLGCAGLGWGATTESFFGSEEEQRHVVGV
jgi:hypothetical protein